MCYFFIFVILWLTNIINHNITRVLPRYALDCARIGVLSMEKKLPTKWGIDMGLFLALFFCPCPFLLGYHFNVSDHNFFSITGDLSIHPSHLLSQTAAGFNWIEWEIWVNTLFHVHCEEERNDQSYHQTAY